MTGDNSVSGGQVGSLIHHYHLSAGGRMGTTDTCSSVALPRMKHRIGALAPSSRSAASESGRQVCTMEDPKAPGLRGRIGIVG